MRDISRDVKKLASIGPATLAADNTPTTIDRSGYESLTYDIAVGVGGIAFDATNKIEFKLTHSDDGTTYDAVVAKDVIVTNPDGTLGTVGTGGIVRSLIAAHAAPTVTKVGYVGERKFTRLLADFSGTHGTGTPIAVTAQLASAWLRPVV